MLKTKKKFFLFMIFVYIKLKIYIRILEKYNILKIQ